MNAERTFCICSFITTLKKIQAQYFCSSYCSIFHFPSILSLNRKMCSKYSCCNQDCIVSKQPGAEECRTSASMEQLTLFYSDTYQLRPAEQGIAWLLCPCSALRDHLHSDCWSWSAAAEQQKAVELSQMRQWQQYCFCNTHKTLSHSTQWQRSSNRLCIVTSIVCMFCQD